MDKLGVRVQKLSSEKINEILEENESLKAIVSDYSELKKFAEEVVEKHNVLVLEYKSKQSELIEVRENEKKLQSEIIAKDEEIIRLKEVSEKLEQRLIDFQNHINSLLDRFQSLDEQNKKHEATISSLERYIEIMDSTPKYIRNERGAGRKKKYTQEQIDFIVEARTNGVDYENIIVQATEKFPSRDWTIKEIKYIFSRYKSL